MSAPQSPNPDPDQHPEIPQHEIPSQGLNPGLQPLSLVDPWNPWQQLCGIKGLGFRVINVFTAAGDDSQR